MGEVEGGMFWENSIETCILSRVKQITSPGWMHETSAWAWCTGKTQRDRVEREVGGGIGMGILVNPWLIHLSVWQKPLQYCKVISLQLIKINEKTNKQKRQGTDPANYHPPTPPHSFQREHDLTDTLTLDFWPPELWKNKFHCILYLYIPLHHKFYLQEVIF